MTSSLKSLKKLEGKCFECVLLQILLEQSVQCAIDYTIEYTGWLSSGRRSEKIEISQFMEHACHK